MERRKSSSFDLPPSIVEVPEASTYRAQSTEDQFSDVLLPTQYYRAERNTLEGEYRLLVAVLEQAIRTYLLNSNAQTRRQRKAFAEICQWFNASKSGAPQGLFSFQSICDVLSIDAATLSRRLSLINIRALPMHRHGRRHPIAPARRRTKSRKAGLGARIRIDRIHPENS